MPRRPREPSVLFPVPALPVHSSATLPVSETFLSIQGEGTLTGLPSFFIRLAGCNLRCTWCDTPYASWSPEGEPRSIAALVDETIASKASHVVLTGGEPMMFRELAALVGALKSANPSIHITIETAGTIDPTPGLVVDLMSISPKLSTSTPAAGDLRDPGGAWGKRHEERRLNLPVLQALLDRHPGPPHSPHSRQLKFVVSPPATAGRGGDDIAEIESLLSQLRGVSPADILLMPEGIAPPTPEHRAFVLNACLARNWRYCHRLHIELFGHTRGT
jgi:7-carboxy-7-deazaguanine synthase